LPERAALDELQRAIGMAARLADLARARFAYYLPGFWLV
jgi:hypothetical protein